MPDLAAELLHAVLLDVMSPNASALPPEAVEITDALVPEVLPISDLVVPELLLEDNSLEPDTGVWTVQFDDEKASVDQMVKALGKAGYTVPAYQKSDQ